MDYLYTLQCLRESAPDILNMFLLYVSEYGQYLGPAIALVIYWCFSKKTGSWMLFSLGWGLTVMDTIKIIACVPRPWLFDSRLHLAEQASGSATGYSFPSGHTTAAATTYGTAAVYASNGPAKSIAKASGMPNPASGKPPRNTEARTLSGIGTVKKRRVWLTVILIIMVLLVAFARNWLGAHTLADVTAAIGIAALIACIMYFVMKLVDRKPKADIIVIAVMALVMAGVMIFASVHQFPTVTDGAGNVLELDNYALSMDLWASMGLCSGWIISWIIERRFIDFSIEGSAKEKLVRAIIGVVIFGLFYMVLSGPMTAWIPNAHAAKFFKRFVSVVIVGIGMPLGIKWWQNRKAKKAAAAQAE